MKTAVLALGAVLWFIAHAIGAGVFFIVMGLPPPPIRRMIDQAIEESRATGVGDKRGRSLEPDAARRDDDVA